MYNVWGMFLLFTKFKFLWKNGVSEKIYASTPNHYSNCLAPTFLMSFKKCVSLLPFKKEGRDYAFYLRDYKGETTKLLPFYMTDVLFTEL